MNDSKFNGIKFKKIMKIEPANLKVSGAACSATADAAQDKPPC